MERLSLGDLDKNYRYALRTAGLLCLTLVLTGCLSTNPLGQNSLADLSFHPSLALQAITIVSGNNQSATVTNALGASLVVHLTDITGGNLANQQVDWAVSGGNGAALGSATSNSNASGNATNTLTLGSAAGTYTVTATIHGTSLSVSFTETATGYSIVSSGLLVNFDAAYANLGTGPYAPGCVAGQLTWTDTVASLSGTLNNFAACGATKGWNGSGSSIDPYRLNFDGTNKYVDLNNPAIFPSGFSARTMCVWAELDANLGRYTVAASYGTPVASQAMYLGTANDGQKLDGGGYFQNTYSAAAFWSSGVWNHICLTFDGTTAKLYANGTLMDTQAEAWDLHKSVAYLGQDVSAGEGWQGGVASFMLYNRALTITEVSTNCKALASRFQGVVCN